MASSVTIIRWAIPGTVLLIAAIANWFYKRQNNQAVQGGRISLPKMIWLAMAVFIYYLLTPIVAYTCHHLSMWGLILKIFWVLMLIRAVVELYLMYVRKNWSPPMGITHNMICMAVLLISYWSFEGHPERGHDQWAAFLFVLILFCLLLDSFYAWQFHRIVKGQTKGEQAIWFASATNAHFNRINKITTLFNFLIGLALVVLVAGLMWG